MSTKKIALALVVLVAVRALYLGLVWPVSSSESALVGKARELGWDVSELPLSGSATHWEPLGVTVRKTYFLTDGGTVAIQVKRGLLGGWALTELTTG